MLQKWSADLLSNYNISNWNTWKTSFFHVFSWGGPLWASGGPRRASLRASIFWGLKAHIIKFHICENWRNWMPRPEPSQSCCYSPHLVKIPSLNIFFKEEKVPLRYIFSFFKKNVFYVNSPPPGVWEKHFFQRKKSRAPLWCIYGL